MRLRQLPKPKVSAAQNGQAEQLHICCQTAMICNALAERNKSGDTAPINFSPLEDAYAALTEKLRPQVFSLGFLR